MKDKMEDEKLEIKKQKIIGVGIFLLLILFIIFLFNINIDKPVFSHQSGFYDNNFNLEIKCLNPNSKIYYTLDGTMPDESSTLYTGPIEIYDYSIKDNLYSNRSDIAFEEAKAGYIFTPLNKVRKGMLIRAIAINQFGQKSDINSGTYFVGNSYESLPVILIQVEPDDFWGYENGIYIKGKIYDDWIRSIGGKENIESGEWGYPSNMQIQGKESERRAIIEIVQDGKVKYKQNMGIRIRGGATRYFEQKSFTLFARDEYGTETVSFDLFPDNKNYLGIEIEGYKSFVLRNWGNSYRAHIFMDPLVQKLVSDREVSVQKSQTCVVFLNGEYWGLYDMKERYDSEYFRNHYGIPEDNIIVVKYQPTEDGTGREVVVGRSEDISEFEKLETFIKTHDLSLDINYSKICGIVDIDSYIDLYAMRIYTEAVDFPFNNVIYWRTKEISSGKYNDGKWRLALYDVDPDLNYPNYYNGFERFRQDKMFCELLQNDKFKERFTLRLCDMMNHNFELSKCKKELENMKNLVLPYICEYYERYGPMGVGNEDDKKKIDYFNSICEDIINFFANQRDYIIDLLKAEGLANGATYTLEVSTNNNQNMIKINSITMEEDYFEGIYFSDYLITVSAEPIKSTEFVGWYDENGNLLSEHSTMSVKMSDNKSIFAIFN